MRPQEEIPMFTPQTMINVTPNGIQVLAVIAPQISVVVDLTVEQLKAALENCLKLRLTQPDALAVEQMMRKKVGKI